MFQKSEMFHDKIKFMTGCLRNVSVRAKTTQYETKVTGLWSFITIKSFLNLFLNEI